eukprot:6200248-Pleurochrysis_carterae.AAC.4
MDNISTHSIEGGLRHSVPLQSREANLPFNMQRAHRVSAPLKPSRSAGTLAPLTAERQAAGQSMSGIRFLLQDPPSALQPVPPIERDESNSVAAGLSSSGLSARGVVRTSCGLHLTDRFEVGTPCFRGRSAGGHWQQQRLFNSRYRLQPMQQSRAGPM